MKKILVLLLLLTTWAQSAERPRIAVTNEPMRYFAETLAGDFAEVVNRLPTKIDPEFWRPKDADIAAIQKADLILMNGATYEKWAVTAPLPYSRMVDTSLGFADKFIFVENAVTHSHGGSSEHSHGGTASITWLDLKQASQQAASAGAALADAFPAEAKGIKQRTQELVTSLKKLDQDMRKAAQPLREDPKKVIVLASHSYYQYWSRAYGVKVASLSWEPDVDPTPKDLADFEKLRSQHPEARFFLWDETPSEANEAAIKRAGLTSIILTPAANSPSDGDFFRAMKANVARLTAATRAD